MSKKTVALIPCDLFGGLENLRKDGAKINEVLPDENYRGELIGFTVSYTVPDYSAHEGAIPDVLIS